MEKAQQYCFAGEPILREGPTTSCQCPTTLQWTTTSYRPSETTWSLSPFNYPPSDQSCLCHRYRNMECNNSKIKTNSNLDSKELDELPKQQEASLSKSKNLKFGIERILTQSCKEESSSETKESDKEPPTATRTRRKNGTRSVFSHLQRNILELHFQQREYVTKGERYHIAMATGISEEQVKIWFQNRRTKKKKLERNKLATSEETQFEHSYNLNINCH